ncbi:amino acid ABC transporter substrate-binding protein [Pseudoalteromonas sp. SG43-3]|uniref:amino acid ABC transporter substrate-binding protein n=1 Tax=Pseudoalteromonas sp. SG43-3 TaxID=2760970 RepID=UPI00160464D5|nr:amino acid ABC transporter substrate-binding protein [Pseudoalteromonas sp. SG43-3]MBB1442037.1 amino acid ABC transporter substrate-binding protein [Pseudoalteromonas sp. SG43-3]
MRINSLVYFFIASLMFSATAFSKPQSLVFCYEDKNIAPMFLGDGQNIPTDKPGASIEILQQLDLALPNVAISFVRKPWRRCLNDLEFNRVNAVIASYRKGRENVAVYPVDEQGKLQDDYAVSEFGSCLIGRYKFHKEWETREVFQNKAFTIAIPNGYGLNSALKEEPFFIHNTFSKSKAFELLDKGVVQASVDLCQVDGLKVSSYPYEGNNVKPIYPPYETSHGYLVFSKKFYEENNALSLQMWQWLSKFESAPVYIKYLQTLK